MTNYTAEALLSLKFNFRSLKFRVTSLKFNFRSLKLRVTRLKFNFRSLKFRVTRLKFIVSIMITAKKLYIKKKAHRPAGFDYLTIIVRESFVTETVS